MQENPIPSFDSWTSVFLLVSSFGFSLALILGIHSKGRKDRFPILFLILGFSFILLQYVFYWTNYQNKYPYLYFFDTSWYLAFGPLVYNYITKFYHKDFKIRWGHFIPAFLCFFIDLIYYIRSSGFTDLQLYQKETLYYFLSTLKIPWLAAISFFIYFFVTIDFLHLHKTKTCNQYELMRKKWTTILLLLFSLFSVAYISYYVLVRFSFFSIHWDYAISFAMSLSIYTIGFIVYREPSIFNGELLSNIFLGKNSKEVINENIKDEFYGQLITHIETRKPYLHNDLRLVQLADELGFSTHLLSEIINQKANKNFNQFINEYRLEEAKKMLLQDDDASIKTIYFDVGFNNKTTFNSAFKNKFHCTPSEFKKKMSGITN